ncbi:MAG: hypothetical protein ACI376_06950 [Candidatus Bruticola sp.]
MLNSISGISSTAYTAPNSGINSSEVNAATKGPEFSYNPQDELVMDPITIQVPNIRTNSKKAPEGEHVRLADQEGLRPNKDGEYIYKPGTRQYVAANTMAVIQTTVNSMSEKFGQDINWAFGEKQIKLIPDGGVMLNAYYSRQDESLNFFHAKDPVTQQQVYSGSSGEIVSHEAGHAILDAIRPGFFSSWHADTNGFHEAFGDLTALYMASQSDEVCELAAQECGGNLHQPNCLSETGELMGRAINNEAGRNVTGGDHVRSLINDFKWQAPHTVDRNPSGTDPLTTECHSWSRIFSGAQYDIMAALTERNMTDGMETAKAIKAAGNESMDILAKAINMSPQTNATYRDIALCMLKADEDMGGKNHDIILNCMQNRNILFEDDDTPATVSMNSVPTHEVTVTLEGPEFGKFAGAEVKAQASSSIGTMSDSSDLINDLKMHIQNGSILYTEPNQVVKKEDLFDKNGNPYMGIVRWTDGKMTIERNTMIS